MRRTHATRRSIAVFIVLVIVIIGARLNPDLYKTDYKVDESSKQNQSEVTKILEMLEVKGRAPKTSYFRSQFGDGWESVLGCDTRNQILQRDLANTVVNLECQVVSGTLADPYTGTVITFQRGSESSQAVQIDHVVALSDAWQKGAQSLSFEKRVQLANDPLELLAVDGAANQEKSDGDAATWLPTNRSFRCQYVARQIAVKYKYGLWVAPPEKEAMIKVLNTCPGQTLPSGLDPLVYTIKR
jgi:hypothetical protein